MGRHERKSTLRRGEMSEDKWASSLAEQESTRFVRKARRCLLSSKGKS